MSQPPHDSPYRDAPSASPATPVKPRPAAQADRSASRKPAKPAVAAAPRAPRSQRQAHVPHDVSTTKPIRSRSRRRRGGTGTGNAVPELTSVPTSRNAYVATRAWLLAEHGPVCAYCGVRFTPAVMTLDHVAPRRGQTAYDRRDNLVLACPGCNMIKRDQAPLAFLLGSRIRAVNLVKYGSHLSPMLVDLARSLVPADALDAVDESKLAKATNGAHKSNGSNGSSAGWATLLDLDDESPYRD